LADAKAQAAGTPDEMLDGLLNAPTLDDHLTVTRWAR
jgi:hypothetical protein